MKQRKNIWERIVCAADLDKESLPGLPLVELVGEHRVLIENHRGVNAYGPEEIQVSVEKGIITVYGNGMELACMTKNLLIITGNIDGVRLRRGSD